MGKKSSRDMHPETYVPVVTQRPSQRILFYYENITIPTGVS